MMKSPRAIATDAIQQLSSLSSLNTDKLFLLGKWSVIALLSVFLAHSMTRLFWLLMPEPVLAPMAELPAQGETNNTSDTTHSVDIEALTALALFGC